MSPLKTGVAVARSLMSAFVTAAETLAGVKTGNLDHFSMFGDLLGLFNQGQPLRMIRDTRGHVNRGIADLKRKLHVPLNAGDAESMLSSIKGIDGSRLYNRGYEFIVAHIKELASPEAVAKLGSSPLYPPTDRVIELTKSFDKANILHTTSFLEEAVRNPELAEPSTFNSRLEHAMRQDGPGAYEHFTRQAVELTYTVAFKAPTVFLKKAIASIPAVEPYILATAKGGNSYYDVLVNAPEFLRALIYIAEANQPEHLLEGADPVFPVSVSRDAADIIDGYLQTVLGSAAKEHVFFSTNRRRVGETHSQPVQEMLEEAKAGGK